jgi:hypothetical protein
LGWLLAPIPAFRHRQLARVTQRDRGPGRLFSFLASKPLQ